MGRGDRVTLELRGLDFMDSSGIRVLLRLHRRARDEQWTLRLRNPRPSVRRTLEVAGLSDLFALGGPT